VLPRQHRLTSRREIKKLYSSGKTHVHRLLVLKVQRTGDALPSLFAFSTSSALGKAVARNRAKRLFREAVRLLGSRVEQHGYNVMLIARPPAREATFAEVSCAVEELFRKAGLLGPAGSEPTDLSTR
jgi:ribonuclease P protein component